MLRGYPSPTDILPPIAGVGQFFLSSVTTSWKDEKHPAGECSELLLAVIHHVVYYAALNDAMLLLYDIYIMPCSTIQCYAVPSFALPC